MWTAVLQRRGPDVQLRGYKDGTGKRGKSRAPWIPPGKAAIKERTQRSEVILMKQFARTMPSRPLLDLP